MQSVLKKSLPPAARKRNAIIKRAFIDSLPVLMGYTTMGFVAGVLLAAKAGITAAPFWALMTSFCVSGTFNFAIVQPISERIALWSVALLVLGINFRYVFYGFSMLGKWKGIPFLRKIFLIHMLTDENYALEVACKYKDRPSYILYCTSLSAMNISYWIAGTTCGALCVALLQAAIDPEAIRKYTNGMEFAMVALFLVIFTDQMKGFFKNEK